MKAPVSWAKVLDHPTLFTKTPWPSEMRSFIALFTVLAGLVSLAAADLCIRDGDTPVGFAALGKYALLTDSTSTLTHGVPRPQHYRRRRWSHCSSFHLGQPQVCRVWKFSKDGYPHKYVRAVIPFFRGIDAPVGSLTGKDIVTLGPNTSLVCVTSLIEWLLAADKGAVSMAPPV